MPLDPLNNPLLRAPRSHAPTIAGMTEAANAATPDQLADFVEAIGAAGGGGGGGGGATNLGATASPTGVTVTSDTGNDADLPLATGANAGLMAPAQHTKLNDLPTAAQLAADQAAQDLAISGKAPATHSHTAAQISDATAPGRALLTAADAAAQRTALALGNVNNTADADKPVSTAQALAIAAATTADAIADTLETAPAADLARIRSSVSGYKRTKGLWANRPVTGSIGDEYFATDLGTAGGLFRWSETLGIWRLAHDQIIAFRDTAVAGAAGAGAQILSQLSIPAGLIMACGRISLQNAFSKSGATDAATNITVRLGITGTISDTAIVSVANPMSAANRSWPAETLLRPLSSTILAPGGAATLTSSFGGSGSGGVYIHSITVPDMSSTDLIFSTSISMAGSTDVPTSQFVYLQGFAA